MSQHAIRIAVPLPTSTHYAYNQRAWPQFAHALESCGAVAVAIPLEETQAVIARLASTCCGIVLPGSPADVNPQKYGEAPVAECAPADPAREAVDELLLQDAFNLYKPIFGICYGMQSMSVWRGGSLIQHLMGGDHDPGRDVHEAHKIVVAGRSMLAEILGESGDVERVRGDFELKVNSSHHQAARTAGDGFAVVARSVGDGAIEALEGQNPVHFVLGVQWHPERTFDLSSASRRMFLAFMAAAKAWSPREVVDSVAV